MDAGQFVRLEYAPPAFLQLFEDGQGFASFSWGLAMAVPLQVFSVVRLQVYNDELLQVNDGVDAQVFSDE